MSSCNLQFFSKLITSSRPFPHHNRIYILDFEHEQNLGLDYNTALYYSKENFHMVSPQTVFTYPFTVQSYKSYCMVSPQTVFTYPFHHAKPQILLHGVTANSLYLSFSPCKATNLTTWCHRKQSLLILFTVQSYKSY